MEMQAGGHSPGKGKKKTLSRRKEGGAVHRRKKKRKKMQLSSNRGEKLGEFDECIEKGARQKREGGNSFGRRDLQ